MGGFSARSSHMELCRSCKDLLERSPPGSSQESHKTCTRSCKDLLERTLSGSSQELLTRACTRSHFISRAFFASLRSRNALGHLRRCMFCENLQEKCRAPEISRTFCWSLHRRKSFGHLRITILLRISRKVPSASLRSRNAQRVKCRRPRASKTRGADFVRACAVDMHLDIAFYAKIYRRKADQQLVHPDQAPAFPLTV